ncbi:MAG: hypothetical protein WCF57_05235, partial [Pyrinomonadaceae bacterium]
MIDTQTRQYEAFLAIRAFGTEDPTRFPAGTLAAELYASLLSIIEQVEATTSEQASGMRAFREGSANIEAARKQLHNFLKAISRTARTLDAPGMTEKFRLPGRLKDQELLTLARSFAADAAPLKTEFVRRGLAADFLDTLASLIANFEAAITHRLDSKTTQVTATAALKDLIRQGMVIKTKLDAIVRNTYANDPATLAAWTSASHVERPP